MLEALVRALVKGRKCFYDEAFCAFVPGLLLRRQQAGFLGVIGVRAVCGCGH